MDKQMQIARFSRGLQQAAGTRDWQALTRLDRELAELLRQWPALQDWSAAERSALEGLQQIHAQTQQRCSAELQQVAATLEQMRAGRGRWHAYAESTTWHEDGEEHLA